MNGLKTSPTIEDIRAAAARIKGHARHTPLLSSPFLDEIAGRRVLVKPECLQHTGSFKFRGAWSALSAMSEGARAKGVFAYSSGNHAQGIAAAAKAHNAPAVILMPSDAPALKIANTKALGAEVVLYDRATESREELGDRMAAERGLTLIKPFDEPDVISGQGTIGLEIAADAQAMGITAADVAICCGGGGLTSGIALALASDAPGMIARPVEPEGFDDVIRSLGAGKISPNHKASGTICDAIATVAPEQMTFGIMQKHCGTGVVVTEEEALRAMALAFQRLKLVVEPGGAVGLAAALFHPDAFQHDTVIAIVSGGNVDPAMFTRALATLE